MLNWIKAKFSWTHDLAPVEIVIPKSIPMENRMVNADDMLAMTSHAIGSKARPIVLEHLTNGDVHKLVKALQDYLELYR